MATGVDEEEYQQQQDHDHIHSRGGEKQEDSSSSSVVVRIHQAPVAAKSAFTMPPKKRLIWGNSLFDNDDAPLAAKSSSLDVTYNYMPPKKRPHYFMPRVEVEEEDLHSSFDVPKSDFTLWQPKQKLRREEEDSSAYNDIIHAPITKSAFGLCPKQSLTSKEHSSVDTHAPVTRCLGNWQIKKRRTSASSPKKIERLDFATQKEEDDYYALKIQQLIEEMREKYGREKGIATKKVKKICRYDVKNHQKNKNKKIKKEKLPTNATNDHNKIRNLPATDEDQLKRFIEEINGSDMKLVIQKKLFESDLKRDQNRLSMPINKLKNTDFLTAEEKNILDDYKVNLTPGIEVGLVGPKLEMYPKPMRLKLWEMRNNKNYVLKTNWSDFVDDNKEYLKKDRVIRVWSFRKDEQLCFAISVV